MFQTVWWRAALAALTAAALSACGGAPAPDAEPPVRYDYALSVDITPQDSRAEVEARYGASALVWHPEAGFAVLGVEGSLVPPDAEALRENNKDAFSIPGVSALGRNSWASGRNSWASGWNAVAGGADEAVRTTFEQNLTAWRQVRLAEGQALAPSLGRGVKVAVIDTGVDVYHPALQGRLAPKSEWKDFVDGDALPLDERSDAGNGGHGHGTGVAGVILQVAPEATILPLRVLRSDGSGDLTDVALAIDWAVQSGADVINLSLGAHGDTDSKALSRVLKYARQQRGVLFAVSSGNSGDDKVAYPAKLARRGGFEHLVSVGSVDALRVRSAFSTYGSDVSLYAPGEAVYTLAPERGVMHCTGTSFAAPVVAGALALALGDFGDDPVTHAQTLLSSVSDDVDTRDDTADGADTGMLDAGRFLNVVKGVTGEMVLSSSTVLENQAAGEVVGRFSVTDGSLPSYSLVPGETDNGSFTLTNDELRTAERFDYETKRSYSVLVEANDGSGNTLRKDFTVTVQNLDEQNPNATFDNPGTLTEGEAVTLTGSASDDVDVRKLELYEDGLLLGEATLAPPGSSSDWHYLYTPRSAGTFTLKLIAYDAAGNTLATTLTVTVVEVKGWSVQFGDDTTTDDAESITADAEGNLYLAGKTSGNLAGTSSGKLDVFVMKLNSRGERVWADQFGSGGNDDAEGVAVDAAGNLYVVGYTHGSLDPEGSNFGNTDAFIAQYSEGSDGVLKLSWRKQFGAAGHEKAEAVAVDAAGNIYITGHTTSGSADFDKDVFVARYDSSGVQKGFSQFGSSADEEGKDIAVDATGNVYITGYTDGDLKGLGSNAGGFDLFIAKYRSSGEQEWLKQFGSEVDDEGKGIAVDAAGNAYVVGYTRGSLELGYQNAGNSDFVIAKYDSTGKQEWLEQFGSASDDGAHAAAIDAQGYIVVTGYTYSDDILALKYDSAGNQVWAEQLGSAQREHVDGIAADMRGNVFITGYTESTLDGAPITGRNIFVMKLDSNVALQ